MHTCSICGKSFRKECELLDHIRGQHTYERPFQCDECESAYTKRTLLNRHKREKHPTELTIPNQCRRCGKFFARKDTLTRHKKTHLKVKPFKCHICGAYRARRYRLREHIQKCHPETPGAQVEVSTQQISGVGTVSCVTHTMTTPTNVTKVSNIQWPGGSSIFSTWVSHQAEITTLATSSGKTFSNIESFPASIDDTVGADAFRIGLEELCKDVRNKSWYDGLEDSAE